jgi:hypothetical protein
MSTGIFSAVAHEVGKRYRLLQDDEIGKATAGGRGLGITRPLTRAREIAMIQPNVNIAGQRQFRIARG